MRTAKKHREGRGEKGKMEKNTMKWLSRLKLSKSFHEPIQQDEGKKGVDSLAFCLLSSLTRRGGKRKGGKCVGWGGIGQKTGVRMQMGLKEVTLLI